MSIRTFLVDDHTLFREALRALLRATPAIEVVGDVGDGAQVGESVRRLAPDVVVMDVSLPGLGGIEATRELCAKYPDVRVLALSAHVSRRFVLEMLGAGALGYVSKSVGGEDLVRAIVNVAQGRTHLCAEAAATLVEATRRNGRNTPGRDGRLGRREKEVLCLLADGRSAPQIAQVLHIAPTTVNVHRRNIMRKVNLHSVAELTKYAIREGLILA